MRLTTPMVWTRAREVRAPAAPGHPRVPQRGQVDHAAQCLPGSPRPAPSVRRPTCAASPSPPSCGCSVPLAAARLLVLRSACADPAAVGRPSCSHAGRPDRPGPRPPPRPRPRRRPAVAARAQHRPRAEHAQRPRRGRCAAVVAGMSLSEQVGQTIMVAQSSTPPSAAGRAPSAGCTSGRSSCSATARRAARAPPGSPRTCATASARSTASGCWSPRTRRAGSSSG